MILEIHRGKKKIENHHLLLLGKISNARLHFQNGKTQVLSLLFAFLPVGNLDCISPFFCITLERNSGQTSGQSWYLEVFGKALSEEESQTYLHLGVYV